MHKIKIAIKLSCLAPLYFTSEIMAMQQITTCTNHYNTDGSYAGSDCVTTFSGGGGGINYNLYYYNQYNAHVNHETGNPFPNHLDIPAIENELESEYDKTVWESENVADLAQAAANIKLLVNYLLTKYNLSPEMVTKLNAAFTQANTLITSLNSAGQITNHLINQEWGYAGSEFATLLAGTALTGLLSVSGAGVIVTTGAMLLAGVYILPEIEKIGDSLFEEYNHEGLLNNINIKFDVPNIFEYAEDAMMDIYCASLPPYKQQQLPGCMIPPIVLDLDGNGIDFLNISESKVLFDVNNDGVIDKVSWPTSGNGVLFADWNSSGVVDTRTEFMFSLYSNRKHASDLEGLKMFDYEDDGDIDAQDNIYEKLFIWNDKNEDGICSTDEVYSLNELGITLHFPLSKSTKTKKDKYKKSKNSRIEEIFTYNAKNLNHNNIKIRKGLAVSAALKAKIQ